MTINPEKARIRTMGRLALSRQAIESYRNQVDLAPHWIPGRALHSECSEALKILDEMQQRLERKLIVTLIGPTGSGKSTLLNVLAKQDDLSAVGVDRPTTRKPVVFCHAKSDADMLLNELGYDQIEMRSSPAAAALQHVILVDSPDMDSIDATAYAPLLEKTIGLSDVLVCVFNAENPKRRDTIDFLRPFVDLFPGTLLYVVLNRCDRLPEDELKNSILPDFTNHLQKAWQKAVTSVFCISARSHLNRPDWSEDEAPLHNYDQYSNLEEEIFGSLNQSSRFLDMRVQRAEHLAEMIRKSAEFSVAGLKDRLDKVRDEIHSLEREAWETAAQAYKQTGAELITGVNALLYQKLAGRWWGPVGWLIAIWARFLMAGAGMVAALRFGNPIVQIWGLISSALQLRKSRKAVRSASAGDELALVYGRYRSAVQRCWPDIAEKLIQLGFDSEVRDMQAVMPDHSHIGERWQMSWKASLEKIIDKAAGRISGFFLQLLLNIPTLALMGMFAYESVRSFIFQLPLPSGYFMHAFVSILIVWLLSFVFFQIIVRFVGGQRMLTRTFKTLVQEMDEGGYDLMKSPVVNEIEAVLRLKR